MGCCNVTAVNYYLFEKLDTKMACDTDVSSFDEIMKDCEKLLEEIEELRASVSEVWGRLLCQTGAVVLSKPSVISCYIGLLFQVSRDIVPEVDKIVSFKTESPFVEIDTKENSNLEMTKDCFNNFASGVAENRDKGIKINKQIEEILAKTSKSNSEWMEQFKEKAGGLSEM